MTDLRQSADGRASFAENVGEAADAVELDVRKKNPFRFRRARRDAAKADADIFAQILRRDKPRLYRVKSCFHNFTVALREFFLE